MNFSPEVLWGSTDTEGHVISHSKENLRPNMKESISDVTLISNEWKIDSLKIYFFLIIRNVILNQYFIT